jgi:hypothetical protein
MTRKKVPIVYGLLPSEYRTARREHFPNDGLVPGGCMPPIFCLPCLYLGLNRSAKVPVCPECEAASRAWKSEHAQRPLTEQTHTQGPNLQP